MVDVDMHKYFATMMCIRLAMLKKLKNKLKSSIIGKGNFELT